MIIIKEKKLYHEIRKQAKEKDIKAEILTLEARLRKAKHRKRIIEVELENLDNEVYKLQEQICDLEEEQLNIRHKAWV